MFIDVVELVGDLDAVGETVGMLVGIVANRRRWAWLFLSIPVKPPNLAFFSKWPPFVDETYVPAVITAITTRERKERR